MLRNYIKIAWRNIIKRRFYAVLNIAGLAAGILFTLLIGAYVWNELRVNRDLKNAEQQYFLRSTWADNDQGLEIITLGPLAKRLKIDYPNLVANYYRWDGITSVVSRGEKHFRESIQLGDSTLLSMYGFKLLHGDTRTALLNPFSIVITRDLAMKYFQRTDVIGQTLGIQSFSGGNHEFSITGVLSELPENSVTQLNDANRNSIFIPTNTYRYFGRNDFDSWTNTTLPSYIQLQPGVSAKDLAQPIAAIIKNNAPDGVKRALTVEAVPLSNFYLLKDNGLVKRMLYALSFVGLFILLMAVVNFINISISSSSSRMKEIGIRKVLGGLRGQIIRQFLAESIILVFISTAIAMSAYPLLQPVFGEMVGKAVPSITSFPLYFMLAPGLLIVVVGFLAGLYPALVLSAMRSTDSLKGKLKSINEKIWLRKSLAGFQFAIAGVVMIAAFVVSRQVNYFFSRGLGYNKEYIVSSQLPRDWTPAGVAKMETIRNEFLRMPEVADATLSYEIPNGNNGGEPPVYKLGTDSTMAVTMQSLVTDEHYISTYQVPLKAGRFFDGAQSFDSSRVIINEKAVKTLGYSSAQEALGQQLRIPNSPITYTIQGVTGDFHFGSMQQEIRPGIFFNIRLANVYRFLSFKLRPGNTGATLESLAKKWAALMPASSFEYSFMDETLAKLYKTELQLKKASSTASVLSLSIVLLGVIGMVSLSIRKKTKEIGIRKVLGASVRSIIVIFLQEFVWVIGIATLVACPLAWLLMKNWLNDYAYRITLDAAPFLFTIAVLAFITFLLIILQTLKAGLANPVKSLRNE